MGAKFNRGASRQDWETPAELIAAVKSLLSITDFYRDLAASSENAKAKLFYTEADNALGQDWSSGTTWNWLNPPYSDIRPWTNKAMDAAWEGHRIAMLVPAAVGSSWWHSSVHRWADVHFLKGRVTFVGASWPYPKDLALLLYHPAATGGYNIWHWKDPLTW